jgi:phosphoribosylformimino-5-aminoimidazole carboxamide ribotide isomerase
VQIIPAIDLLDGKCVRLYKGSYENSTLYNEDPLALSQIFEDLGVKRLHIVDLNGAKEGKPVNHAIIQKIALRSKMLIEVGGGIRNLENAKKYRELGVGKIILGSVLVKNPELIPLFLSQIGRDNLIAGIDFQDNIFVINGWLENTQIKPHEYAIKLREMGFVEFIFTDVSKDGTLQGPNFNFYQKACVELVTGVIASGGIGCEEDLNKLSAIPGVSAAIVGKAYYENKINLKNWL